MDVLERIKGVATNAFGLLAAVLAVDTDNDLDKDNILGIDIAVDEYLAAQGNEKQSHQALKAIDTAIKNKLGDIEIFSVSAVRAINIAFKVYLISTPENSSTEKKAHYQKLRDHMASQIAGYASYIDRKSLREEGFFNAARVLEVIKEDYDPTKPVDAITSHFIYSRVNDAYNKMIAIHEAFTRTDGAAPKGSDNSTPKAP